MIPTFPVFKKLEIADQHEFVAFTRDFAPYSDFNFVTLASYDVRDDCKLSWLNGNLVIRLFDCMTLEPFYTFIGTHRPCETARILLDFARANNMEPTLRFVPEVSVLAMNNTAGILAIEDPNSFDYILSIEFLTNLSVKRKRRSIESFRARYPHYQVVELNLGDLSVITDIRQVLLQWKKEASLSIEVEFSAINRCLQLVTPCRLIGLGIYLDGKMISFTINEVLHDGFYMGHFGKSLPAYRGLNDLSEHETARVMQRYHCTKMNYQEDMGLEGLRFAKRSWEPISYLKKYTLKNNYD